MARITRRELFEMRRRDHEEYLRRTSHGRYRRFTLEVEGGTAVVRGFGGAFEVRFPARRLWDRDALSRCGF